ncbi:MAG TPA: hemerythrin domain-containing protein [Longimicrobiales bacterium]|nr:hemerythrin domain-containing protein [Longimicrobiales bacterium]
MSTRQASSVATDILRREHMLILRVAGALERMHCMDPLPLDDIDLAAMFCRLYTDSCHHGKEEDLLFAALEDADGSPAGDLVAALRDEHVEGRRLVGVMVRAIARVRAGDAREEPALRDAMRDYVALIRGHILKEDDGLFEVADGVIRGAACDHLCAAYETVCARRFEGHSAADLQELGESLVARYR